MQIEIDSPVLDQAAADYQAAETMVQSLEQEFRDIVIAIFAPAEPGSLTLLQRLNAAIHDLPGAVIRRDELSANKDDLQAFAATVAANEAARQKSELLKQLDKRVQALSEEIQANYSKGLFSNISEQNRRQRLVNQYGSTLVGDIEQRVREQVGKSQAEEKQS